MDLSQWIAQHASRTPATRGAALRRPETSAMRRLRAPDRRRSPPRSAAPACQARRPRRLARAEQPGDAGAAVRLRAARRDLHAAELAPGRAGAPGDAAAECPPRCCSSRTAFAAPTRRAAGRAARRTRASRSARTAPRGWIALGRVPRRAAAAACRRRRPTRRRAGAAVLHLRLDRPAQGRAAEPGGAGLQRRQQRRHARPGQPTTGC